MRRRRTEAGNGILLGHQGEHYGKEFSSSSLGLSNLELETSRPSGSCVDEVDEQALSSIGGLASPDEVGWLRRLRRIEVIRNDWRNDCLARSTVEKSEDTQKKYSNIRLAERE